MRKAAITVGLLGLAAAGLRAETLKLRSGAELQAPVASVDGRAVTLQDGRVLPRDAVEELRFAVQEAQPAAAAADPEEQKRGRELFRQAEEFGRRYPGVDGLVLLDEGEYRLKDDGTWVERSHFAGRILKEGLKRSWGEVARYYEEGRDRVKIIKATVYHPDGKVFALDPDKIKTSQPQGGELSFSPYRVVSYPMPQVVAGAIVEYEVETETYNPFRKDFFFPAWGFQSGPPVLASRVSISIPKTEKLYSAARNFNGSWSRHAEPTVVSDGRTATYSWELRDLPPIVGEPMMVPYGDFAPVLKAALFKDWGRIYDWLGRMHKERTKAGPELARFTKELVRGCGTRGCGTDDEKAAAIYHYIQKDIRYIAVKMGVASGWGGYDANLTWKRRYGCCIDKALLFTAMLDVAGIPSSPILVDTNREAEHDFRIPSIAFEHAITSLKVGGRSFILDSTGYDYRYPAFPAMDHGVRALNVFARKVEPVPAPRPEDTASRYDYAVELGCDGGASVRYTVRYSGAHEGEVRGAYKRVKESERKKTFQDWLNGISPSAELVDYRLDNLDDISLPFSISLSYRLKDYAIRAGDLRILKLPAYEEDCSEVALEKRRYDLRYPTNFERKYHYELALPAGTEAVALLAPARFRGPKESFTQSCSSRAGRIVCDSDLKRWARLYKISDYRAHKAFLEKVSQLTKDRIFLRDLGPRGGAK
jgi:transglutaminase-like putative cysteine protease